ncbi:hypothetical protein EZS27_044426, partial [termite gut metagenome]
MFSIDSDRFVISLPGIAKQPTERIHSYRKLMTRIGGTKLHYLMNKAGYRISRKTLFSILRTNSLLVRKRKKYAVTTDSRHWMKKYPNLIRGFDFDRPNLLWV